MQSTCFPTPRIQALCLQQKAFVKPIRAAKWQNRKQDGQNAQRDSFQFHVLSSNSDEVNSHPFGVDNYWWGGYKLLTPLPLNFKPCTYGLKKYLRRETCTLNTQAAGISYNRQSKNLINKIINTIRRSKLLSRADKVHLCLFLESYTCEFGVVSIGSHRTIKNALPLFFFVFRRQNNLLNKQLLFVKIYSGPF